MQDILAFAPDDVLPVRDPNPLTHVMLAALARDGFLLPDPDWRRGANTNAFLRPKSSEKACFIADLRAVNTLSAPPPFTLPSLVDIGSFIGGFPVGQLWGTAIDLTNFFWSLRLPRAGVGMFRIAGLLWDSLPFGWNMSPILAQTCLGELIQGALGTLSGRGVTWQVYHYYDDLLVLGETSTLVHSLTQCLLHHFTSVGLLISKKSNLLPTQDLVWLGKRFELTKGTICNTSGVLLHVMALAVLAQVVPVHRKLSERVTGYLLWGMRPHLGATLALRAWYLFPWHKCRYLPKATTALRESLGDCVL